MNAPRKVKQHYVPKFLLRNFSKDNKSINHFLLSENNFILNASIKGQCQEKFFYGENEIIENALAEMEGVWSKTLYKIMTNKRVPEKSSQDFSSLLIFVAAQRARTRESGKENIEIATTMLRETLRMQLRLEGEYSDDKINEIVECISLGTRNPANNGLRIALTNYIILSDLKIKILLCDENFIIGDNPAVFCNFYREKKSAQLKLGYSSRGLIIFLPITPSLQLILYDPFVYKIGNKRDVCVDIKENDALLLNELQYIQAGQSVYYLDRKMEPRITTLSKIAITSDVTFKTEKVEWPSDDSKKHNLAIKMVKKNPILSHSLSFVKIIKKAKKLRGTINDSDIRNQGLYVLAETFDELVNKGKYRSNELKVFIDDYFKGILRQ